MEAKSNQKRNRLDLCLEEDSNDVSVKDEIIAKKPREELNDNENTMQSSKSNEDDYDDDDYDDIDDAEDHVSDNEDFLEDFEDDVSVGSSSTTVSTGSSVCSNTPSLVGENLESFTLSETEKSANSSKPAWTLSTPLVQISAPPLKRSLFSNVPPTINFVHHNEVSVEPMPAELRKLLR